MYIRSRKWSSKVKKICISIWQTNIKLKHVNVVLPESSEYDWVLWVNDISFITIEMDFIINITQLANWSEIVLKKFDIRVKTYLSGQSILWKEGSCLLKRILKCMKKTRQLEYIRKPTLIAFKGSMIRYKQVIMKNGELSQRWFFTKKSSHKENKCTKRCTKRQ